MKTADSPKIIETETEMRNLTEEERREILIEEVEFLEYDKMDKMFNFKFENEIIPFPVKSKKEFINMLIENGILENEIIEVLK